MASAEAASQAGLAFAVNRLWQRMQSVNAAESAYRILHPRPSQTFLRAFVGENVAEVPSFEQYEGVHLNHLCMVHDVLHAKRVGHQKKQGRG
jgi:hypothetical protein